MQPSVKSSPGTTFLVRRPALVRRLAPLLAHPASHVLMSLGILLLDLWTGPLLMFPILFVVPVGLAALFCRTRLAQALAVLLPLGRFLIAVFVDTPANVAAGIGNALVQAAVLSVLAFLVGHTVRQSQEIKVLRGRLPICMWCKRIRNEGGSWQTLEAYITAHSEADFSHSVCPECKEEHYGHLLAQ